MGFGEAAKPEPDDKFPSRLSKKITFLGVLRWSPPLTSAKSLIYKEIEKVARFSLA